MADEDYPKYIPTKDGFKVQMSKATQLPGVFLNIVHADRAIERYNNNLKAAVVAKVTRKKDNN